MTTAAHIRPGSARAWLLASRPKTLPAAIVPVVVGSACAHALGGFRAGPAIAALIGAILIQIGTNFANDVFDFEKGADDEHRVGPTRAAQAGLLSPRAIRLGMGLVFALAVAVGLYLTWVGGWPIVAIGLASITAGIAYTGGPFPLGYHGLGDLFVMIFFGFVAVCGTVFVQLGHVPALAWWASVPVGALATAILVVNNVRDRETDTLAGKRTLAVRLGALGGHAEYIALLIAAFLVPPLLVGLGLVGAWCLLALAAAPLAVADAAALVRATTGDQHNRLLAATARLLMLYGALFATGIAL